MPHERKHPLKLELYGSHLQHLLPILQQEKASASEARLHREILAVFKQALNCIIGYIAPDIVPATLFYIELSDAQVRYLLPTPQQHTFPEESERAQELLARLNAALTVAG